MRITLNQEEKAIMKKHGNINLKLLCLESDYFGHYYIESTDKGMFVRAKKRGLNLASIMFNRLTPTKKFPT